MKMNCDFYVRDKQTGTVHRVGDDQHDSIWVDTEGELHYSNLQNGDGCSGKSALNEECGYEFVPSDCGAIDGEEAPEEKSEEPTEEEVTEFVEICPFCKSAYIDDNIQISCRKGLPTAGRKQCRGFVEREELRNE